MMVIADIPSHNTLGVDHFCPNFYLNVGNNYMFFPRSHFKTHFGLCNRLKLLGGKTQNWGFETTSKSINDSFQLESIHG